MKIAILTYFLLSTNVANCQDKLLDILPLINGKVTYQGVISVDSVPKTELYNRVKRWFVDTYHSAKDVIQLDDKETGEVIGKGFFETYWQITFYAGDKINIWQTIKVQVKDNRFRYLITDFKVKYYVSSSQYTSAHYVDMPLEEWNQSREENCKKVYSKIDLEVLDLIESLSKSVKSPVKEDW